MGTSIIASVDAPPVPEPAEHALDFVALAQCRQFPLNSLWEGLLSGTEPERLLVGPNPTRKNDPSETFGTSAYRRWSSD